MSVPDDAVEAYLAERALADELAGVLKASYLAHCQRTGSSWESYDPTLVMIELTLEHYDEVREGPA